MFWKGSLPKLHGQTPVPASRYFALYLAQIGWLVLGEPMPLERWIGFGLVWVALTVLTVDSLLHARRVRAATASVAP